MQTLSSELQVIQQTLNISDADFEKYIADEREYLAGLKSETPEKTLQYQYVEDLIELATSKYIIGFFKACTLFTCLLSGAIWLL